MPPGLPLIAVRSAVPPRKDFLRATIDDRGATCDATGRNELNRVVDDGADRAAPGKNVLQAAERHRRAAGDAGHVLHAEVFDKGTEVGAAGEDDIGTVIDGHADVAAAGGDDHFAAADRTAARGAAGQNLQNAAAAHDGADLPAGRLRGSRSRRCRSSCRWSRHGRGRSGRRSRFAPPERSRYRGAAGGEHEPRRA